MKIESNKEYELIDLSNADKAELDALPYGVIILDVEGVILEYNKAESELANKKKKDVIGKNFFTEVAPCTNVESFAGEFRKGVASKHLFNNFDFIFKFPTGFMAVTITMYLSPNNKIVIRVDNTRRK